MKIVMIVPYPIFPADEGGRVRARNLLKQLAVDHDVVLLTPRSPANATNDLPITIREITPPGARHQILSPSFLRHAAAIARDERPDVVIAEYPWPALHAWWLSRAAGARFVLDAPNVEADRFRSTASRAWPFVAAYERLATRLASRVFTVSNDDRARFIRRGVPASKIEVVPNGVDPDVMHPDDAARAATRRALGIDDQTRLLLFFGQLNYAPNRDAIATIAREIAPRLDRLAGGYEIVIAGKGDIEAFRRDFAHPRLRFTGVVAAIAPYINTADAVIAPIGSGGGTRLKVLESVACGTPVVSTPIGAEGIDRDACADLLVIADGWDSFAEAALDRERVKRGNVPARFLDMYSWTAIVRRVTWP